MGVCTFFLQGTCRFGDNCRYEHTIPNYNSNIIPVRQQQPQLPRQQPQLSSSDFCDLVKHDLELASRKQWPLSCYCPFPSKSASLPGLEDYSPEEIRCLMYQAQANGNVESCIQHIQKLYQDAEARKNLFKSQSPDCRAILESVRSGPASPSSGANPFLSGDTANSSGRSIFGGSVDKAIVQAGGMFGGSAASIPQASVFGGGSCVQSNPFGAANAPVQQTASIFGGGGATASINPFIGGGGGGGQPSPFGASPTSASLPQMQASTFGGAYSGQQPSVFGGQTGGSNPSTIFGGASPAINSFSFAAAAQSQGLMGSAPAPQTFVVEPPPSQAATASTSIFGGSAPSTAVSANPFGTPTQLTSIAAQRADSGAHTAFDELTEEEKAEFMAPTFSKGRIPLRPPPNQLCT